MQPIKRFPVTKIFFLPTNLPITAPIEAKIILLQTIRNVPIMGLMGNDPLVIV
jgi:hypothetical protein